jgi:formylglycine-generating enzyme required for sulfatase activity
VSFKIYELNHHYHGGGVVRFVLFVSMLSIVLELSGCASTASQSWKKGAGVLSSSAMRLIPGGTFQMGSESQDIACTGCSWGEQPVHGVTLSAFYMDTAEIPQGDFQSLMGVNPSNYQESPRNPVEMVTWFDAVLYCNARSKRDGLDTVYQFTAVFGQPSNGIGDGGCRKLSGLKIGFSRNGYRLPTEAEWEYACRAGTTTEYYWGRNYQSLMKADTLTIDSFALWYHNSSLGTRPGGSRKPNAWGLYSMAGNVSEWCNDYIGGYSAEAQTDPVGPDTANSRIVRGGSWCDHVDSFSFRFLRSAFRASDFPDARTSYRGFRCVRRP